MFLIGQGTVVKEYLSFCKGINIINIKQKLKWALNGIIISILEM